MGALGILRLLHACFHSHHLLPLHGGEQRRCMLRCSPERHRPRTPLPACALDHCYHLGVNGFCAVGVISATGEAWIYTILDVLAKSVFGAMIVCHNWTNIRKCLIFHDGCGCSEKATRDGHSKKNDYDDEDLAAAIVSTSG